MSDKSTALMVSEPVRKGVGPALALIPGIGGALSATWAEYDTTRRLERIQKTIDELGRHLLERALDPKKLTVEDMVLLEMTLQRVHLACAEDKRSRFARSLASSWTDQRSLAFEERALFIRAIAEFRDEHIRVLHVLTTVGPQGFVRFPDMRDRLALEAESDVEQDSILIPVIDTLSSQYGFIRRAWGLNEQEYKGAPLFSKNLSPEGITRKANLAIAPLGQRFLDSIAGHDPAVEAE